MMGQNTDGQLGTTDNNARSNYTQIGYDTILTDPEEINIPVGTTMEVAIALGNSFNLKTDFKEQSKLDVASTNEKELSISTISGVDNTGVTDVTKFAKNYIITGNKIGRVNVSSVSEEGLSKNIWINVVDSETSKVSSKVSNGDGYTIALRSDGTVWGFGNINNKNHPEKYEVPEEIIDISTGKGHALLLGKSGAVYTFGANAKGELGTGNTSTQKIPTKISISNITKVVACRKHIISE